MSTDMPSRSTLFDARAKEPLIWLAEAIGLMRSAYVLWDSFIEKWREERNRSAETATVTDFIGTCTDRFVSAYMLLAGLAVENAVKGLILSQIEADGHLQRLPKGLKGHDLTKLLEIAGLTLTSHEQVLAYALKEAVAWKGRYPLPLNANVLSKGWPMISCGKCFSHPQVVSGLLRRVTELYPPEIGLNFANILGDFPTDTETWTAILNNECPEGEWPE